MRNSYYVYYLVVQQEINAINCYFCGFGADGCGPSFSKTGSGVLQTNDPLIKYCTVSILLRFFVRFEFLLFIEKCIFEQQKCHFAGICQNSRV